MTTSDSKPPRLRPDPDGLVVHVDARQRPVPDDRTRCGDLEAPKVRAAPKDGTYRKLFEMHYGAIREVARGALGPGLLVVAVHVPTRALVGRVMVEAIPGEVRTVVLGRHRRTDLPLSAQEISLRHLLVIVPPISTWRADGMRYQVTDLRTPTAFVDEAGRHLEGLTADGPAFIALGSYALMFLRAGDSTDWPRRARDAWEMLPSRIYEEQQEASRDRWLGGAGTGLRKRARAGERRQNTLILATPPPVSVADGLFDGGGRRRGRLDVQTANELDQREVGQVAARRGILLGRYARCAASRALADPVLSRAHVLLKEVDGRMWALDTASTAGISAFREPKRRRRVISLHQEGRFVLAGGRAVVGWRDG